ncbi:Hypothetical protein R9X50_00676500 [Acrodontium crateriforme]|uniref:Queuine tRNA-ribosyltransferase accessory subunit 2 n=1 Tax=Acrodontium crateriforme TaxID=150365 RepID=A0AAQ3M8F8_9PEZI|nr:Hypothetical protein R9X50_00676500 [Acrodontium crateriforme]
MGIEGENHSQVSDDMFSILKSPSAGIGPRLGRLSIPGRHTIETPHYLGITSRGAIPHISQDTFARDAHIQGVYVPLEDFIERAPERVPPLYLYKAPDGASPLRRYIALPDQSLLVLGARRCPPVAAPAANSNTDQTVSVSTNVGFKLLHAQDYREAVEKLDADILVALGDIQYGRTLGSKRITKAVDRNIDWLQDHIAARNAQPSKSTRAKLFASLLPVSCDNQKYWVEYLADDAVKHISGLALYDSCTLADMPQQLRHLPVLGFTLPETPHEVLRQVGLGMDVTTIPFITYATDAGIALDFTFPSPESNDSNEVSPRALGVDMWPEVHATDLSPFKEGCQCYACTNHHRAFIQHLLAAKEMLGWVLIQIHNHHTMDLFFAAIRESIRNETFDRDVKEFARVYESQLPAKTGKGPRVRGYQFKSEGPGEPKKNTAPFQVRDKSSGEGNPLMNDANAQQLENQGFAEKTG